MSPINILTLLGMKKNDICRKQYGRVPIFKVYFMEELTYFFRKDDIMVELTYRR